LHRKAAECDGQTDAQAMAIIQLIFAAARWTLQHCNCMHWAINCCIWYWHVVCSWSDEFLVEFHYFSVSVNAGLAQKYKLS